MAVLSESVIGQRFPRIEGLAHVTGRTRYVDDIYLPGMLYAAVRMAEYHNARIINIDISEAEKLPGVVAVVTGKDIPNNRFGFKVQDQPVLADDYVRHLGQPVAAVAATRPDIAWEAVQRIKVEYEPLPPVFDALEAMKPDAPAIHEGGNVEPVAPDLDHRRIRMGDCEAAFKEADVIVEDRLSKSMREHTPMEVHVSVAELDAVGKVVIYSCSQLPHLHQLVLSGILKLPLHKIDLVGDGLVALHPVGVTPHRWTDVVAGRIPPPAFHRVGHQLPAVGRTLRRHQPSAVALHLGQHGRRRPGQGEDHAPQAGPGRIGRQGRPAVS